MRNTYTLAEARDIEIKEGTETISWTPDFKTMMRDLNPPDYIVTSLKEWEGMPVPTDRTALAAYRFVSGAVPNFWDAALNTHVRGGTRAEGGTIPLLCWKEFWDAPEDPPEDDLMALMRKVVHAKLIAVAGERPDAAAVAGRTGEPARLTEICLALMALDDYAMGAPKIAPQDDYLPERVASDLDAAGIKYTRDMAPLSDATELRKNIGWLYCYSVVCSGCRMVAPLEFTHRTRMGESFFLCESDFSHPENHKYPVTEAVCRLCFGLYGDYRPYQGDFIGAEERTILSSVGTHPDRTADVAAALAFAGGSTRARMDALMRGSKEAPVDPEPTLCPMADTCKTFCGQMQRDGRLSRPLTANGMWQSCEYGAMIGRADKMADAQSAQAGPEDGSQQEEMEGAAEEVVIPKEQMAMF